MQELTYGRVMACQICIACHVKMLTPMVLVQSASLSSSGRPGAQGPTAGAAGSNGTNATRSGNAASGSGVSGVSFSTGRRLSAYMGNAVPASVLERPGGSEQLQVRP